MPRRSRSLGWLETAWGSGAGCLWGWWRWLWAGHGGVRGFSVGAALSWSVSSWLAVCTVVVRIPSVIGAAGFVVIGVIITTVCAASAGTAMGVQEWVEGYAITGCTRPPLIKIVILGMGLTRMVE